MREALVENTNDLAATADIGVRQAKTNRLHYLSNLRTSLTLLVVCHHSAIALGAAGGWYFVLQPREGDLAPVLLTFFAAINQSFFMSLFFFVSAYLTPPSFDRKGAAQFLKDRFLRLGIPLAVYFCLIHPSLLYMTLRFSDPDKVIQTMTAHAAPDDAAAITDIVHRFAAPGGESLLKFIAATFPYTSATGPLWFVFTLLLFAILYAALRTFAKTPLLRARPLPSNKRIALFVAAIGLTAFLLRIVCPVGVTIPFIGLQPAHFPLYICMYVFGVWAYRERWLDAIGPEHTRVWFRLALVVIVLMPCVAGLGGAFSGGFGVFMGGLTWQAFVNAAFEPVLCVGICLKLLYGFREHANRDNALTRTMSSSAYTAYIIHPFFVIYATHLLEALPVNHLVKFALLCPMAVVPCFLVSDLVRRLPLLRKIL